MLDIDENVKIMQIAFKRQKHSKEIDLVFILKIRSL